MQRDGCSNLEKTPAGESTNSTPIFGSKEDILDLVENVEDGSGSDFDLKIFYISGVD